MDKSFLEIIQNLEPSCQRLLDMAPVTALNLSKSMPKSGIYLFSEADRHLYVGRTRDIRGRIGRHSRPGATHRMAVFAFRLAREATGNLVAAYKTEGSRGYLMESPQFRLAFEDAKKHIRVMDLRFVA